MTTCKKCDNQGTVLLRKKDLYCEDCFTANINHKFRACIGKNKILSVNENVLVCFSGGSSSTALLDFIHNGISINNHKKLWIKPIILHILEKDEEKALSITEQCNNYNFENHLVHISEYVSEDNINTENTQKQFKTLVESMPISSRNDFLLKIKRDLFLRYAKKLHCRYIFTAETSGTLAINLLSNLCNGRGSQVLHDVGFSDARDEVKILRPMRDISQEELQSYIQIKQLVPQITHIDNKETSIQAVIKNFVTDLQENFPSTVSTVCKTADKIGIHEGASDHKKCKLCESDIEEKYNKLSALEATNYSRTVSIGEMQHTSDKYSGLSMFPHVNKRLCYTCSRHYSEMDEVQLPEHIRQML